MSVDATKRAWDSSATGNELLVLLKLADHAGGLDDPCADACPGVPLIASATGLSDRTVQRCLRQLESDGRIAKTGERYWGRGKTTNVYRIDGDGGGSATPKGGDSLTGRQPDGATPVSPKPSLVEGSSKAVSSLGTATTARDGTSAVARASDVPDDFPDELRPHARHVYRVLSDLARRQGAAEVSARSLAHVVMARPTHPLVEAAHDYAAWAESQPTRRKDVVAGYRNWLSKCGALACTEPLPGAAPPGHPAGVTPLRRREHPADRRDRELAELAERLRREERSGT